jgi:hypothetical protein
MLLAFARLLQVDRSQVSPHVLDGQIHREPRKGRTEYPISSEMWLARDDRMGMRLTWKSSYADSGTDQTGSSLAAWPENAGTSVRSGNSRRAQRCGMCRMITPQQAEQVAQLANGGK